MLLTGIHRHVNRCLPLTCLDANPQLDEGGQVLDVVCGTGILSMFAARGGAAAVVGLEARTGCQALLDRCGQGED